MWLPSPGRLAAELRARAPARAYLRLLRDGQVVARTTGRRLAWVGYQPGAYRLEAYRRYAADRAALGLE